MGGNYEYGFWVMVLKSKVLRMVFEKNCHKSLISKMKRSNGLENYIFFLRVTLEIYEWRLKILPTNFGQKTSILP